jgi:hypothetical protein
MAHDNEIPKNHVGVLVATTAGTWPTEGYETIPEHQKIDEALKKAARDLAITNTAGWIAIIGGRTIDPATSYVDNKLSGSITIDFGPPASGGGGRA